MKNHITSVRQLCVICFQIFLNGLVAVSIVVSHSIITIFRVKKKDYCSSLLYFHDIVMIYEWGNNEKVKQKVLNYII